MDPRSRSAVVRRSANTLVICLLWMCVSSGLILLNNHLMRDLGFKYPMTVAGIGQAFSSIASYFACRVFKLVEENSVHKNGTSIVNPRFYFSRIMPIGFFMAGTLFFGNLVYLYLSVSFIQMLKSFTPVITMIMMFLFRLENPSRALIGSVLLIAIGTGVASAGEINLSGIGLMCMFLSALFESLRLVLAQTILFGMKFHPVEGLMYFAPACVLWLGIGMMFTELQTMISERAIMIIANNPLKFVCAGMMGFFVNSLTYSVIVRLASSLSLKVLGTVKDASLVWMGIIFLQELVTPLQGFGYLICLAGFSLYTWAKKRMASEKERQIKDRMIPVRRHVNG